MKKDVLQIAVIGLGRMGTIYLRTLAEVEGVRLCAADVDIEARAELLRTCGVERSTDNADELLSDSDTDAVIVAAPTRTHARMVVKAAEAGKDVFCEKPLALTLDDTYTCLDAVRSAATVLQVGFMRRFDPEYRRAEAWIGEGRIGTPIIFHAIGRDRGCPPVEFADPSSSGGLVLDMGIHDFDLARWLMKAEVVRVSAEVSLTLCRDLERVGDVDSAVINLRFDDGELGTVEVGRNGTYGYDIRTEVVGTGGTVRMGYSDAPPSPDGDASIRRRTSPQLLQAGRLNGGDHLVRRFGAAYKAQILDFVECIRSGRSPQVTGEDALKAFEIALAASRSAEEHRAVEIDEVREAGLRER